MRNIERREMVMPTSPKAFQRRIMKRMIEKNMKNRFKQQPKQDQDKKKIVFESTIED